MLDETFFDSVFDAFSRRESASDTKQETPKPLSPEFRARTWQYCLDSIPLPSQYTSPEEPSSPVFWEVRKRLRYRHPDGPFNQETNDPIGEIESFLASCNDAQFLDFIEDVLAAEDLVSRFDLEELQAFVDTINKFFRLDDLPYALTSFQFEESTEQIFDDKEVTHILPQKPTVIRRDSQVTHESAVEPAFRLLEEKQFSSANSEFLEAMEDFRHGDYRDCLTKACSAMESTMKIICDRRDWKYSEEDSAGTLVETVVSKSSLEGYFQQPLIIVATLRNRLSASHGAGTQEKQVPEHLARYTINATASNILLLVEECT